MKIKSILLAVTILYLSGSPIYAQLEQIGSLKTTTPLDVIGTPAIGAELRLREGANYGTRYIGLKAPDDFGGGTSTTYRFPPAYPGTSGFVLSSTTAGVLSWVDNAAGTGMSNPMEVKGDLIYASTTATPATPSRLGIGTAGQVLETYDSGGGVLLPRWGSGGGLAVGGDGTPAGQIQFETAGGLDGNDEFYYDITGTPANLELHIEGSKAGTRRLYLRNTSDGAGSDSGINIGNNTATDQLTLRINSSTFTGAGNYSYLWSKANAPMVFGVNNEEVMRLAHGSNTTLTLTLKDTSAVFDIDLTYQGSVTFSATLLSGNANFRFEDGVVRVDKQLNLGYSATAGVLNLLNSSGYSNTFTAASGQGANISYTLPAANSAGYLYGSGASPSVMSWVNPITVATGGTGLTSLTANYIPIGAGTSAFGNIPPTGTNTYLKWTGSAYAWDTPAGGGTIGGSGTAGQVAYFTGSTTLASESNFKWDATNDRLGIKITPSYTLDVKDGQIRSLWTANQNFGIDSDAWGTANTKNGYYSDWTCNSANMLQISQAQVLPTDGVTRHYKDGMFIQHQDNDTTNYQSSSTGHVSHGLRVYMTGNNTGNYNAQYKDMSALNLVTIGNIAWSARGVSGILNNVIQYGSGIASNEFSVQNITNQSVSMALLQMTYDSLVADVDVSHVARGLMIGNNGGYKINSGIYIYGSHQYIYGVDISQASVSTSAIQLANNQKICWGTKCFYSDGADLYWDGTKITVP